MQRLKHKPTIPIDLAVNALMENCRVAVIYSGDNQTDGAVVNRTYHTRHWKSYQKVAEDIRDALVNSGFQSVVTLPEDMNLLDQLKAQQIDLAWLNTGGMQGRNAMSHAAALLDMAGIPFIGHNPLNYGLLDHKLQFKLLLRGLGIPTADFVVWDPNLHRDRPAIFKELFLTVFEDDGPWVVKPVNGRGSRYIQVASNFTELMEAIEGVYRHTLNQVLVETYLSGREYCVAGGPRVTACGGRFRVLEQTMVFACMEKAIPNGEMIFTSMDQRPIDSKRAWLLDKTKDAETIRELTNICRSVCDAQSLKFLVRLDLREDAHGNIMVLEANPKPDLKRPESSAASLVAMGLEAEGWCYEDLVISLLSSGLHHALCFRPSSIPGLVKIFREQGLLLPESDHDSGAPTSTLAWAHGINI